MKNKHTPTCRFPLGILILGFLFSLQTAYTDQLDINYPEFIRAYPSREQSENPSSPVPATVIRPLAGNPPARSFSSNNIHALHFECHFKTRNLQRAGWDIPIRVDLRDNRGIRFKIRTEDITSVAYFAFYFKSGNGWYTVEFSPRADGQWQTIEILKSQTKIEGNPAGWRQISTLRISAWQSSQIDTSFDIAGFGILEVDKRLVIARGSHPYNNLSPGEKSVVVRTARRVSELLSDYGLKPGFVEESDLDPRFLTGVKTIILPYNPAPPHSTARYLEKFTEEGGKLIGFHSLPNILSKPTGLKQTGLVNSSENNFDFQIISPSQKQLVGAPVKINQNSWNIAVYEALNQTRPPRILAYWLDQQGTNTGYPALLATQTSLWMSHILLNTSHEQGGRLLLAMVAKFIPEIWKEVAENRIHELRPDLPYRNFDHAFRTLQREHKANRVVQRFLAEAAKCRKEVSLNFKNRNFYETIKKMDVAEQALIKAYVISRRSRSSEFCAVWCHRATGVKNWQWEQSAAHLKNSGFNAIFANIAHPGQAWYPSNHLPVAPGINKYHNDRLKELTEAGRKHDIEVHVWLMAFRLGSRRDSDFVKKMRRQNRLLVNRNGTVNPDWLCPVDPRNQMLLLEAIREIVEKYEVDGIHLDYVRFPSAQGGYGNICRKMFEAEIGYRIKNWPDDLEKYQTLNAAWREFRVRQINKFIHRARQVINQSDSKIKMSAAVFRNENSAAGNIGQDWPEWARRDWVDFVTPMNYTKSVEGFKNAARRQIKIGRKFGVKVYPGIGLTTNRLDTVGTIRQIEAARESGAEGFVIFEYNHNTAHQILPELSRGITKK